MSDFEFSCPMSRPTQSEERLNSARWNEEIVGVASEKQH